MKLALAFYLGIILLLIYNSFYISEINSQDFTISDFRAQYSGAVLFRRKMYDRIYDLRAQFAVQKEIFPKLIFAQLLPFFSPPLIAMLLSPLASLSLKNAYLAFCISAIIILIFTSLLFFHKTDVSKKAEKLFGIKRLDAFLLLSAFFPFWLNILSGQLTLLWVSVFFSAYLFLEKKNYITAGLILSLLSLKPHLLFVPLLFFLAVRKWKVLASAFIGSIVILFIESLFGGINGLNKYFSLLWFMNLQAKSFGLNVAAQVTLKGTLFWLFKRFLHPQTIVYIWLTIIFIIIWLAVKYWSSKSKLMSGPRLKLLWSTVVTITLLTSPHTHYHDFALFIIPIFLTIQYLLNDYLVRLKQLKKSFWFFYVKYAGILILILLSSIAAYFPPIALISYIVLIYFIAKKLIFLEQKIQISK